ncbi:MAG: prephenate dehydrogenase [Bacteroidota bacterium]
MSSGPSTVTLVGTGLIGASVGLALRRRHPDLWVIGVDASDAHAAEALRRGAITEVATIHEGIPPADLVVLATPLDTLAELMRAVGQLAKPGAVVTDVGSVKGTVLRAARQLPESVRFVGGHPMAGATVGGPSLSDPLLFENAVWVLCPTPQSPLEATPEMRWLTDAAGARVVVMDAERHDAAVAAVSHVPQLLAVALVEAAAATGDDALTLAAGGFRDMTRIAGSPFSTWRPILEDNREAVLIALNQLTTQIDVIRSSVASSPAGLADVFERAGATRASLPASSKGSINPLADVVVWADDAPGFLHSLTGVVADAGLNLRDAELLRIREGEVGTFRFGFSSADDADEAVRALTQAGYRATRR